MADGGGQFFDRSMDFIRANKDEPSKIAIWKARNRVTLQQFWARAKADALELNEQIERALSGGAE